MNRIILITYLICATYGLEKVSYKGDQVWDVKNSESTLKLLQDFEHKEYLSIRVTNATNIIAVVKSKYIQDVQYGSKDQNVEFKVVIEDMQELIDSENVKPLTDSTRQAVPFTWNYYHVVEDFYGYLQFLATRLPKLCTLYTIGTSVEGRPIQLLKISNGRANNKAIFLEGGIHASEWIGSAAATYIIQKLVSTDCRNSCPDYLKNTDWYIVPLLNPDGYVYSYTFDRHWRKNRGGYGSCPGVDLNRNWDFNWATNGSSDNPCQNTFRGLRPFSEPETSAILGFFNRHKTIHWISYISLHSYGQYILYPWAAPIAPLKNAQNLEVVAQEAISNIAANGGEIYTAGPAGPTIHYASGSSLDWSYGTQNITYSFTIESRDRGYFGVVLPAKYIVPASEEAFIAVQTIVKTAYAD